MPEFQPSASFPGVTDTFTQDYLICAEWADLEEDMELPEDVQWHPDAIAKATKDCKEFRERAGSDLDNIDEGQAGHDFWLTRQGHGAGFWDRPTTPKEIRDRLTALSREFGEQYLELGDDGVLHFM